MKRAQKNGSVNAAKGADNPLARQIPAKNIEGKRGASSSQGFSRNTYLSLMLAVVAFVIYANTFQNGFAIDDIEVIQNNSFVNKGLAGIPQLLTTPHLKGFMTAPNETYRPLSLVMFAVEYQVFGLNPAEGHVFNVFVFIGCVLLLFRFLNELFDNTRTGVAFLAALLFAVHPIHTEVVANIKSRDELLSFLFSFLSLVCYLKYNKSGKSRELVFGVIALFLALISKETAITFSGIVPLVFLCYKNDNLKRSITITASALVSCFIFIAVRAVVLKLNNNTTVAIPMMDNALAGAPSVAVRLATAMLVLGHYLKLLFIPYPLICDYSFRSIPYVNFSDPLALCSVLIYAGLAGLAIYRLVTKKRDPLAFAILFYIITLSLFSNIFILLGSGMNERFLFFPSVGFCLAIALGTDFLLAGISGHRHMLLSHKKAWIALSPVLLIFSYLTITRNTDWENSTVLFETDLKKAPDNSRLNYCVGYIKVVDDYEQEKEPAAKKVILKGAIEYLRKALDICPNYISAQTEIGQAYFLDKQFDSSQVHDEAALKINPNATETLNNLAGVYFVTHQYDKALSLCRRAITTQPGFARAYFNIGLCFNNMHIYDSSIIYLHKCLELDPGFSKSFETMAYSYKAMRLVDSAIKYEAIAKRYNPGFRL